LVRKKNGDFRLCVDYETLNKATARRNNYISMAEDSVKYISFIIPLSQFEYIKMTFGLKTALSKFQWFCCGYPLMGATEIRDLIELGLRSPRSPEGHTTELNYHFDYNTQL